MNSKMLLGSVIFTITFHLIDESEQRVLIENNEESSEKDLFRCVNRVVTRHFVSGEGITVLSRGSKDPVKGMGSGAALRLVTDFSKPGRTSWFPEVKDAVIFLEGDFPRDIEMLDSLESFQPRSRLLVASITPDNASLSAGNYLNKVVDYIARSQILSVVLAVAPIGGTVELYGYTKTAYGYCGQAKILRFGNCYRGNNIAVFADRIDYNRCPLRLATFDWSPMTRFVFVNDRKMSVGIESNIVNVIVDRLNASTDFLDIPPSEIRKSIGEGKADIGWGQMALYQTTEYSYTKSYVFANGIILLPESSSAFQLTLNNLLPLGKTVWTALLIVVASIMVLRCALPTFKIISLLNTFGLCLGLGIATRPRRLPHRLYFISWALFGYVITQAYLANLTLIFTKPDHQSQIKSVADLEKSTMPLGGAKVTRRLFQKKYPRLYEMFKVMNLSEFRENLIRLKMGNADFAMCADVSRYANYDHWKNTVTLPEKITSYPIGMVVPNVSNILTTCNSVITKILEAGLMSHWAEMESVKGRNELDPKECQDIEVEDHTGLQKFLAIFELLIAALSISFFVFIVEIIVFKLFSKKKIWRPCSIIDNKKQNH